uniref:Uncharacterized protein n=1 Tax=Candidatus Kentrum sp. TC TaxID=2126339 RepID=A0A450YTB7_9GAMM|nr:MAG: hypothetical protein BECKTC1821D_GA0114238_102112 [Candidatus Kentron sp. TC]
MVLLIFDLYQSDIIAFSILKYHNLLENHFGIQILRRCSVTSRGFKWLSFMLFWLYRYRNMEVGMAGARGILVYGMHKHISEVNADGMVPLIVF